ncbi:MarR family transcriptional regulator [Aeromicrobium phragmitis]|uniref:MarR family transcriptional regulator n=1 Tax=Aeromicrobium phragmitis TaxID=2478914 RepID=A0A3L8PKT4_9ACTN|nr:MarR family transcriptional regulator [Aeromicrobium phragmitis]
MLVRRGFVKGDGKKSHVSDQTHPPRVSDLEMLRQVTTALTDRVAATLAEHELTVDQWNVLRSLTVSGPQSMSDLVERTRITGPTLSRVVDKLAERALVYRNVDAGDRRRVLVHAADRGHKLVTQIAPLIDEVERHGLASLSASEVSTLRTLLARVASA